MAIGLRIELRLFKCLLERRLAASLKQWSQPIRKSKWCFSEALSAIVTRHAIEAIELSWNLKNWHELVVNHWPYASISLISQSVCGLFSIAGLYILSGRDYSKRRDTDGNTSQECQPCHIPPLKNLVSRTCPWCTRTFCEWHCLYTRHASLI